MCQKAVDIQNDIKCTPPQAMINSREMKQHDSLRHSERRQLIYVGADVQLMEDNVRKLLSMSCIKDLESGGKL